MVLDSWAVLRFLEGSAPAAAAVEDLLEGDRPILSWIDLGEDFSVVQRAHGEDEARGVVRDIGGVVVAELPSTDDVLQAGRIKGAAPVGVRRRVRTATALGHDARLWTGDPDLLLPGAPWRWRDLR